MPENRENEGTNPAIWIAWGLISLGFLMLYLFTETHHRTHDENGVLAKARVQLDGFSKPTVSRQLLTTILSIAILGAFVSSIRVMIHHLAINGVIPAQQFSPAMTSGVIIGIHISLVGYYTDTWSKRLKDKVDTAENRREKLARWIYSLLAVLAVGEMLFLVTFVVISWAYSPIQYLISPEIVSAPIREIGRWSPNERTTNGIIFSSLAAIATVFYLRFTEPLWEWVHAE